MSGNSLVKRRIEYEIVVPNEDDKRFTSIILKIDGQEFELSKNELSHLEGIIIAVFDRMVDPFDAYLAQDPSIRIRTTNDREI